MFIRQFPDINWLKAKIEARFQDRVGWKNTPLPTDGWPTLILNAKTQATFRDDIKGPFSVFLNLQGSSRVKSGGKSVNVNEDFFFLTNRDQSYTLEIESDKPVETFNLHFGDHFAEQAIQSLAQSPSSLLESPFDPQGQTHLFYNRMYARDAVFNQYILALQDLETKTELVNLKRDELMYGLFLHLFQLTEADHHRFNQLPVVRKTTREEISKRLMLALDFMHSYFDRNLSLDELAGVSCLSKFHFLRLFKLAFGKTPYQYLKQVRMQRGIRLLKHTGLPVNRIAEELGFENANSFTRAVVQHSGISPSAIRAN